jgi:hypothetical protein
MFGSIFGKKHYRILMLGLGKISIKIIEMNSIELFLLSR